jgi:hypothetical protein
VILGVFLQLRWAAGVCSGGLPLRPVRQLATCGMAWHAIAARGNTVLYCYGHDLYDGQQMRAANLEAWRVLRERYGNRDESRVERGTILAHAA